MFTGDSHGGPHAVRASNPLGKVLCKKFSPGQNQNVRAESALV
jgi:hypothetical protein